MFFAVMDNPLLSYTRVKKTDYDMEDKVKNKIRKDVIKWELEYIKVFIIGHISKGIGGLKLMS